MPFLNNAQYFAFLLLQPYQNERPAARYWLFSILIIEVVISFTILMIWGIRLFKKGKKLVENDSNKGSMKEAAKIADKENPLIDNHLYKLAKVPFIYYVNTCNFCLFQRSPFTTSNIETSIITSNVRQKIADFQFVVSSQ